MVERLNLSTVNKRCFEALAMAGGFDGFAEIQRQQYTEADATGSSFIEQLIRYGSKSQNKADQAPTLFGNMSSIEVAKPRPSKLAEWPPLVILNKEKEVIGIYLSSHPLDNFKMEMNQFCSYNLSDLRDLDCLRGKDVTVAGMVTTVKHATTKNGKPYGSFTIEDYSDTLSITLFSKDYENFRKFLYEGYSLLIKGTVAENTWKSTPELEFRIKTIHMLSSVREELVKTIQIRMPIDVITDGFIHELTQHTNKNSGNTNLKILVYDPVENVSIDFFSRSHRIALADELLEYLSGKTEIDFKLY